MVASGSMGRTKWTVTADRFLQAHAGARRGEGEGEEEVDGRKKKMRCKESTRRRRSGSVA